MYHGNRYGSREGKANAECERFQPSGRHCWRKKQIVHKDTIFGRVWIELTPRHGGEVGHPPLGNMLRPSLQNFEEFVRGDVSPCRKPNKTVCLTAEDARRTGPAPVDQYLKKEHSHCLTRTNLSHLSLLLLQGSQFIAFRVRFAGRVSSGVSLEDEPGLGWTSCFAGVVLVIADRDAPRRFEA